MDASQQGTDNAHFVYHCRLYSAPPHLRPTRVYVKHLCALQSFEHPFDSFALATVRSGEKARDRCVIQQCPNSFLLTASESDTWGSFSPEIPGLLLPGYLLRRAKLVLEVLSLKSWCIPGFGDRVFQAQPSDSINDKVRLKKGGSQLASNWEQPSLGPSFRPCQCSLVRMTTEHSITTLWVQLCKLMVDVWLYI